MSKDDGGPIFPRPENLFNDGITLRDYFAAKAPKDLADNYTRDMAASALGISPAKYTEDFFGNWCLLDSTLRFQWADAMLKARQQ